MLSHAGNQRVCDIVGHLRDLRRLYGLRTLTDFDKIATWAKDHYKILDAIASGDPAATEHETRVHLMRTRALGSDPTPPTHTKQAD
jgi:DNA-binding GntR family transcriptional regulator